MEGIFNIAGAMMRTGTTTLAIQLVRALEANNYHAAYVEMNPQNYIWGVNRVYNGADSSDNGGKLSYDGVDMYAQRYYKELTSGNGQYDYLVCDYGSMVPPSFNISAFNNCDASIITVGVKPNEFKQTEIAISREKSGELTLPIYAFFRVPVEDEEDVLDNMPGIMDRSFFIPDIPDPFARIPSLYRSVNVATNGGGAGVLYQILNSATIITEERQKMKRAKSFRKV